MAPTYAPVRRGGRATALIKAKARGAPKPSAGARDSGGGPPAGEAVVITALGSAPARLVKVLAAATLRVSAPQRLAEPGVVLT